MAGGLSRKTAKKADISDNIRPLFPRVLIALRPWSFPAALSPLFITFTILYQSSNLSIFDATSFALGIVALQGAANLLNSLCDYKNGLDKVDTAGDRTMVDELVTKSEFPVLFVSVIGVWFLSFVWTLPIASVMLKPYLVVYVMGVVVSVLYSLGSPPLKYIGFGDLVVFMSFGPLLVVAAVWACSLNPLAVDLRRIVISTVPAAILVVAILHANNHRDSKMDEKNSARTVSVRLGIKMSMFYYWFLVLSPVVLSIAGGLMLPDSHGLMGGALILPMSLNLCRLIRSPPRDIDAQTAKVMLLYGLLASAGLLIFSSV